MLWGLGMDGNYALSSMSATETVGVEFIEPEGRIGFMSDEEQFDRMKTLAIGRVLKIMSRPYQPGDEFEYEYCKRLALMELGEFALSPSYLKK